MKINPCLDVIEDKVAAHFLAKAQEEQKELIESYYQSIRSYPRELEFYFQLLKWKPEDADVYFRLGKALIKQGYWQEAIAAYRRSLKLNPHHHQLANYLKSINFIGADNLLPNGFSQSGKKISLEEAKANVDKVSNLALEQFLNSNLTLIFPKVNKPLLSIIIVLYNRAELTLMCLQSIKKNNFKHFQLIIVDNNSTDKTRDLLKRLQGVQILLNQENIHFVKAANQASKVAKGDFILFLNNDTQILVNSINVALETIKGDIQIGCVGGKMILPDGRLQEAGGIIWQNGEGKPIGLKDAPNAPEYMFRRSVDFCSGGFLLTRKNLFLSLGGFDQDYQPAYYEATDYCVKLAKMGKKIIYEPQAVVLHYQFASSSHSSYSDHVTELRRKKKRIFHQKHNDWLKQYAEKDENNYFFTRHQSKGANKCILCLDKKLPYLYSGTKKQQRLDLLDKMLKQGYLITLYPLEINFQEDWQDIYANIPKEVEIMRGYGLLLLADFLQERRYLYNSIYVL